MKNLLLTLMVVFVFTSGLTAQIVENPVFRADGQETNIDQLRKEFRAKQALSKDAIGWFVPAWDILDNYYVTYDYVNHYANIMFPDSSTVYESGGTFQNSWLHAVGGVLDPYSVIFDPNLQTPKITPGTPYNIDSIFVLGWYTKNVNAVDTLRFEIVHGTAKAAPNYYSIVFSANQHQVSAPKLISSNTLYGPAATLSGPTKTVIKYPLTDNDSTMGDGKYIQIPLGITIPANEVVGLNVTFIPGYNYSFGDSLFSYTGGAIVNETMNAFRVGLYGVADATATPLYFADDPLFGYNLSFYVPTDTRYQLWAAPNPTFLNEIMYPTANWGMDIGYHLSVNTGVESQAGNVLSLSQNQPNPFNDVTTIRYTLSEAAEVNFDLFDQTGKKVMNIKKGVESAGIYTIDVDASNLQNGIYFYTMTAGNQKVSKKMVVLK
ncbi:MAG: T9SS type A sorting domain-containing protein [Bacteroidales bacterium]